MALSQIYHCYSKASICLRSAAVMVWISEHPSDRCGQAFKVIVFVMTSHPFGHAVGQGFVKVCVFVFGHPHELAGTVVLFSIMQSGSLQLLKVVAQLVGSTVVLAVKHPVTVSVAVAQPTSQTVLPFGHFFG